MECLRRLINTESFDDEAGYALAVCNLKQSPKDLSTDARAEDHALRGMQALLRRPAVKLLARLKKEKALDAADLYFVGFHFADTTGSDREFGEQLLKHVAESWPRSPEGKDAKSKLKLSTAAAPKPRAKK